MKSEISIAILLTCGAAVLHPDPGGAAVCANGVYNVACAGPNGAVAVQNTHMRRRLYMFGRRHILRSVR